MDDSKNNNVKLQLKFGKQIKINKLILLSDGRLCSTSNDNSSFTIYDKYNYQIQSKIRLKSLIEDIVELYSDLIVKQKDVYELKLFRKKDFKLNQLINQRFVVETIFEVNKKLIICTKNRIDLNIEIWEKDKNNLYILTGSLINNLISSFCFICEEKIKANVFFCGNPLSKGLKDNQLVMQAKNKMDQEYSKLRDQTQELVQEREELKKKIQLLNNLIYQLNGGHEEIYKSQSQFNPMMPHSIQPSFMYVQMNPYFQQNPFQQMMGMQTQYQFNPMMSQGMQYQYYHEYFNPMTLSMNPYFHQGMMNPFYQNQFNPMTIAQRNIQIPQNIDYFDGELVWKESTKFSTNILINYSNNKVSSINLDNNVYCNIKVFTIKANENRLVSAYINKYTSPKKIISIKICDLENHIGNIMIIESGRDFSYIDSIIEIDGKYILFGIWLIDINLYQIVFKFSNFNRNYVEEDKYFKKYFKLLNGNILIYSIDKNFSGEYKFEKNQLVKINENFIEESDIIIENKYKEIITYSNNMLKIWEKSN